MLLFLATFSFLHMGSFLRGERLAINLSPYTRKGRHIIKEIINCTWRVGLFFLMKYGLAELWGVLLFGFSLLFSLLSLALCVLSRLYGATQNTVCKARLNKAGLQKISLLPICGLGKPHAAKAAGQFIFFFLRQHMLLAAALLWHSCLSKLNLHFYLFTSFFLFWCGKMHSLPVFRVD